MIRHMLTSALGAGLVAGIAAAFLHFAFIQQLILTGETYETGAAVHFGGVTDSGAAHDHGTAAEADDHGTVAEAGHDHAAHDHGTPAGSDLRRNGLTVVFYILTQVSFALLLVAGFGLARSLGREVSAREGILWGIAGFAALQLAPAMGLPPELPGTLAADLGARQAWWLGTVVATAAGLALLAFGRGSLTALAAVALVALPHLIGAPVPDGFHGVAPPELAGSFAARALGVGLAVWAILGWTAGRLWSAAPA
jgi:cobalt transporter subunit CbtA